MAQVLNRKRAASSTSFLMLKQKVRSTSKPLTSSGSSAATDYPKNLIPRITSPPIPISPPATPFCRSGSGSQSPNKHLGKFNTPLLSRIKAVYESYLASLSDELLRKQQKVAEMENLLAKELAYGQQLSNRQSRMAYEALETTAKLEQYSSHLEQLQRQTRRSANRQTHGTALHQASARVHKLKDDVKAVQAKHTALKQVRQTEELLEKQWTQRGFPVEQVRQQINPVNNSKLWLEMPSVQDDPELTTSHSFFPWDTPA